MSNLSPQQTAALDQSTARMNTEIELMVRTMKSFIADGENEYYAMKDLQEYLCEELKTKEQMATLAAALVYKLAQQ